MSFKKSEHRIKEDTEKIIDLTIKRGHFFIEGDYVKKDSPLTYFCIQCKKKNFMNSFIKNLDIITIQSNNFKNLFYLSLQICQSAAKLHRKVEKVQRLKHTIQKGL